MKLNPKIPKTPNSSFESFNRDSQKFKFVKCLSIKYYFEYNNKSRPKSKPNLWRHWSRSSVGDTAPPRPFCSRRVVT